MLESLPRECYASCVFGHVGGSDAQANFHDLGRAPMGAADVPFGAGSGSSPGRSSNAAHQANTVVVWPHELVWVEVSRPENSQW
jgi:hypothetical protein